MGTMLLLLFRANMIPDCLDSKLLVSMSPKKIKHKKNLKNNRNSILCQESTGETIEERFIDKYFN